MTKAVVDKLIQLNLQTGKDLSKTRSTLSGREESWPKHWVVKTLHRDHGADMLRAWSLPSCHRPPAPPNIKWNEFLRFKKFGISSRENTCNNFRTIHWLYVSPTEKLIYWRDKNKKKFFIKHRRLVPVLKVEIIWWAEAAPCYSLCCGNANAV